MNTIMVPYNDTTATLPSPTPKVFRLKNAKFHNDTPSYKKVISYEKAIYNNRKHYE